MKSPSFWLKLRCSSLINGQQSNRKSPLLWNALFKFQQLLGDITCGLLVPASLGIMRLSLHIQQDIDIVSLPRQCSKPFLRTTVHHLARHLNSQVSLQLCSAFFSLSLCFKLFPLPALRQGAAPRRADFQTSSLVAGAAKGWRIPHTVFPHLTG